MIEFVIFLMDIWQYVSIGLIRFDKKLSLKFFSLVKTVRFCFVMLCVFLLLYGVVNRNCRTLIPSVGISCLTPEQSILPVGEGKKERIHARRIRFSTTTNERPHHVSGGAKMKKIWVSEAGGVLIIAENCFKLLLVGVLENAKNWYTGGRHTMVNLYNVTRKLAFGNKLVIIEVIFASLFTLSWGISFWVLPR